MKKDVVIYPTIFSKDGDNIFVRVPDLKNGFTQGNNIIDAVTMSEDLIGNLLENQTSYPEPSDIDPASLKTDEKLVYITVDLNAFRREFSQTVQKSISIPVYLNDMAKSQKLDLSQVLTNALKTKLEA
ncbi:antitoxin HicB [Lactobacillus sp. CBA3606]|uniref:type II toxin-antitoxin system HicB family antitoxin n=1 Tax=Lactobacillus sp. CBA3606 TaxID=2099789 RepID=UPI000CFBAD4C|nr:type II toxin-antitoxin system HicB family antitoxin [Lactobacillus sp. CBA3606]AVK63659.1 antitoxin HicB [Lactobacillus sp. CBA3606]